MRGGIAAIVNVHSLTSAERAFVGGKPRDVISCRLPCVGGGQFACHVSLTEVVHHKFVSSRVTRVDGLKGLRKSFHDLDRRLSPGPFTVDAILHEIGLVLMLH